MNDKSIARIISESPEISNLRRRYVRDRRTGQPRGMLVSFRKGDKMYIGHAFCALEKKDTFKKCRALFNSLENAVELNPGFERVYMKNVPNYAEEDTQKFWDKNLTYWTKKGAE